MSAKHVVRAFLAAAALAACGDPLDVASQSESLRAQRGDLGGAMVVSVPDDTPACMGLSLAGDPVSVYVVGNAPGTLAVMESSSVVCLDDEQGVLDAGVPAQDLPSDPLDPTDPANGGRVILIGPSHAVGSPGHQDGPLEGTPLPAAK